MLNLFLLYSNATVGILSSLDKSQMLGSVIGLQAALQHSPFAFVVCSHEVAFSRLKTYISLYEPAIDSLLRSG